MKTKAQSALEYMMTYGWAILIIVIVAAVLYSMGIFNPSAASGNTSSGFGGFSVTSYSCSASKGISVTFGNNIGYTITPSATPLVLSSSGLASGVSLSSTASPVVPGGTFTVKNGSAAPCGTAGSKYSLEFTFSYLDSQNNLHYNTTGTVQGTVAS